MTTIASDGRVVAADGRAICGQSIVEEDCVKLKRKDGRLFGIAGWQGAFDPVVTWILSGANVENVPKIGEFCVVEFCEDYAFFYRHDVPYPDPYKYPCAFGSGQPFALAAMAVGCAPHDAVRVACKFDPNSGGFIMQKPIVGSE